MYEGPSEDVGGYDARHAIVVARQSRGSHATAAAYYARPRPLLVPRRCPATSARYVMLTCSVVLLALFVGAQGRAVNISNTWVLPEEGFPVFYRYFRDRISWYEADAVCQFHHANLVTVDTTAQYDAVRAYLKELDISSAVWVGLIRSNPDGDFTWTDYRGLSGDGYWSTAPDERAAPLCAAADPSADYRWEARACGGPTVASFICELPVPQWALGNEGCMVRALPALTALYLPESAAVQLTADCGLAGVKRVQCTGNVKRENLLKDLSCADENETSSPSVASAGTTWPLATETAFTDQDAISDVTTEDLTTEHGDDTSQSSLVKATPVLSKTEVFDTPPVKTQTIVNQFNKFYSPKIIDVDLIHNNNLQSNDIPKLGNNDNFLSFEQTEKLEDEKHMHHKMLHDELARHGNFETIFTQPTDHFVPPLVMAKAKISDDMTVLSLAEKHAQQLAEQRFAKHKTVDEHNDDNQQVGNKIIPKSTTEEPNKTDIIDKLPEITNQPQKSKGHDKKETYKSSLPKKYKEKYNDPKTKTFKVIDNKLFKIEKSTEISTQTESTTKIVDTTILPIIDSSRNISEEESPIEITVILKEPNEEHENQTHKSNYLGDVAKLDVIRNNSEGEENASTEKISIAEAHGTSTNSQTGTMSGVTMVHEVIKVTIINEDTSSHIPTTFEVTTKIPEFKNSVSTDITSKTSTTTQQTTEEIASTNYITTNAAIIELATNGSAVVTTSTIPDVTTLSVSETAIIIPVPTTSKVVSEKNIASFTEGGNTTKTEVYSNSTTPTPINTTNRLDHNTEAETTVNSLYDTTKDKSDVYNSTDIHDEDFERNSTDMSEGIDDFQSPLLSAANEPLHRPNRSRRPQPVNRINKFNPFRILG